jgi:hypothetical protein
MEENEVCEKLGGFHDSFDGHLKLAVRPTELLLKRQV